MEVGDLKLNHSRTKSKTKPCFENLTLKTSNLLQIYPHIFSADLHRPKKWSLEPMNQWKYANQQKTLISSIWKFWKGWGGRGGDGRATFVPHPTPSPSTTKWGWGWEKTTKQQSLPETLKWDGSVKRVLFSLSSSIKCRACPEGPTPHRLDKCRCRRRGQSHCKFHCWHTDWSHRHSWHSHTGLHSNLQEAVQACEYATFEI